MIDADKLKTALNKTAAEASRQLDAIRDQIQQIDDELHWLENAPLPLSDALKNIEHFVDKKSDMPGINRFFYQRNLAGPGLFDAKVKFDHDNPLITLETGNVVGASYADVSGIICALFGSTIKRQLSDMATNAADGIESGPPLDERPSLKADLLKRRHALEIDEEKIISTAEELGLNGFFRRADCNPEIVLLEL